MRISDTERSQLVQLVDTDHPLEVVGADFGYHRIRPGRRYEWARQQVEDWRTQHPADCKCWAA